MQGLVFSKNRIGMNKLRRESLARAKWRRFGTELFGFWKCDEPGPVPTAKTLAAQRLPSPLWHLLASFPTRVRFTDTTENLAKFVAAASDGLFADEPLRFERVR